MRIYRILGAGKTDDEGVLGERVEEGRIKRGAEEMVWKALTHSGPSITSK